MRIKMRKNFIHEVLQKEMYDRDFTLEEMYLFLKGKNVTITYQKYRELMLNQDYDYNLNEILMILYALEKTTSEIQYIIETYAFYMNDDRIIVLNKRIGKSHRKRMNKTMIRLVEYDRVGLGRYIKKERLALNLDRTNFCDLMNNEYQERYGLTPIALQEFEEGRRYEIPFRTFYSICNFLGIDVQVVLDQFKKPKNV